jgi:hypothetical protein
MKYKKSSLNLSINAIVVLILAITLLGLGLGFITKQFGSATESFDDINQQLESEIISEMESNGELITMNMKEFEVEAGSPQEFYIGVRNTDSDTNDYFIQFICDQVISGGECRPNTNIANGLDMYTSNQQSYNNQMRWFSTFNRFEVVVGV